MPPQPPATYAVLGDLHGHLQLALCTLARWQRERETDFSAVFLVGDVGTFIDESQLDNATRKHARDNPCELEFLAQWAVHPQAPWIDAIFRPPPDGLGLNCPVVMVHGNHEGFAHLQNLYPRRRRPLEPVSVDSLPDVDTAGRIKLLPPGWTAVTAQGHTVAGIGGIEPGQRRAKYHDMAYIEEPAVDHLKLHARRTDILLTHQGPSLVQGDHGSPTLDTLLDPPLAPFWFHGHSTPVRQPQSLPGATVVPLGDVAFHQGDPGSNGWAVLEFDNDSPKLNPSPPPFLREARQKFWQRTPRGLLVHPDLVRWIE
jgi:hypothetical protein